VTIHSETADKPASDQPLPRSEWRRLSARMLLIHPIRELIRSLPALAGVFLASRSTGNAHWWSLIGVIAVITLSVIRWTTTRYRITPEQVQLRSGLIRKRTMATPADRVRSVDVTEHALHRVLGLAKVEIGTGISDRKREGLVLDGLTSDAARQLRAELLHRVLPVAGPAIERAAQSATDEQQILVFNPGWVRYAPFTLSGALTGLAIAGFAWRIVQQTSLDAAHLGAVQSTSHHLHNTPIWLDVMQIAFVIAAFVAVLSIAGYVLAFWNFRLTRHPEGTLHVARGLITARSTSIEYRRLRGIELSEPLLLRAVGGARLLAVVTGLRVGRGAERGGTLLAPPAPVTEVTRVAAEVIGSAEVMRATLIGHGSKALRRRLIRAVSPSVLVLGVVAGLWVTGSVPGWAAWAALLLLPAAALIAIDRYRSLGHLLVGRFVLTRYGSLVRRRVVLDSDGIIGWNLRRTFFQRRAGLVTLAATTAAGRQSYRITDVAQGAGLQLATAAVPGLLDDFIVSTAGAASAAWTPGRHRP
jgi:putative membrane protein